VHVTLCTDSSDGSAGAVADRLRVLLYEELCAYKNLRYCMLAQVPGTGSHQLVNLDELPKAGAGVGSVMLCGERVSIELLKEEFAFWLTTSCEFNFVRADELRRASTAELPVMLSLQELRKTRPTWLTRKKITFEGALSGAYVDEYAALSYRWETAEHPDPRGMQLRALQEYLRAHPTIRYVFVDYKCLAQGKEQSPRDKAEFRTMLPNINLLYLGCSVLALMFDKTYMERFWPQLEAWLAFMRASKRGLVSTPEEQLRCVIECLGDTPIWFANALKDRWLHCDAARAHRVLSEPWVEVTNQSDKEVQLYKISHLDFMVRRHLANKARALAPKPSSPAIATPPKPAGGGASSSSIDGSSGGETMVQKVARIKKELDLDESLTTATAVEQANKVMEITPVGGLPTQVQALLGALGI